MKITFPEMLFIRCYDIQFENIYSMIHPTLISTFTKCTETQYLIQKVLDLLLHFKQTARKKMNIRCIVYRTNTWSGYGQKQDTIESYRSIDMCVVLHIFHINNITRPNSCRIIFRSTQHFLVRNYMNICKISKFEIDKQNAHRSQFHAWHGRQWRYFRLNNTHTTHKVAASIAIYFDSLCVHFLTIAAP